MTIDPLLLSDLEKRREEAQSGGGKEKIQARHENGLLTAQERVDLLFDNGTFQEFGMHAQHACHDFGMDLKRMPRDGVITGVGSIDGSAVAVYSHDFTVGGGSLGRIHAKKVCDLMDFAGRMGIPVLGINDSGGARIQEGVDSLSGYGQVFYKNVLLSGVVPQITIIAGPCAGGAAYSPGLTDFLIMTRENAHMFICGPEVIKAATGENASLDQFATADAHASISGNIHLVAEDDQHAIDLAKKLLSFLPPNNLQNPPHSPSEQISLAKEDRFNDIIPADSKDPFNVLDVIRLLLDNGDFFEIQKDWAKNIVIGFGRIGGIVTGIVANQPIVKAGTIDIDAADKAARFIRICNTYNIPLATLVDVPGFLPGLHQEQAGIIRHGAKMLFAFASATVPKITLIMRKAYGGAYLAMCSADMGADLVFAWPTAEIAVMGADGAVNVLFKKEIQTSSDPKAKQIELIKEYHDKFASPYQAAANGMITDVIDPSQTRSTIAIALRNTLTKRTIRLPKKHGNIPL
ncbi:MAG: methylmalonyl-CoA carboxyltransferase [Verrucomicrobia bacterium GWC2_42_7]|nr:MAG: methylmalonyl-CoA carboxyltransferase [Verrucomicrobia bacterium GWC2_42_7]